MEALAHNLRSNSEAVAHKTRMGFNLIEAAIVLAVVGGVIGGIWYSASAVTEKSRQKTTLEMLTLCVNKMRMALKQVPAHSYIDGDSFNNLAVSIGAIPESRKTAYGPISIAYEDNFGGRDFVLILNYLTQSACIAVVSFFSNNATTYGLTRVIFYNPQVNYTTFPIITSSITSGCSYTGAFTIQFNY